VAKIVILIGVATWYAGPLDDPLFCDCGQSPSLLYTRKTKPWIAMDLYYYNSGWECGDEIWVYFGNHPRLKLALYDAGPLLDYYIEDFGPDMPIVGDIPAHLWPYDFHTRSAPVRLVNHSLAKRTLVHRGVLGGVR
jgi:hypothetical protein